MEIERFGRHVRLERVLGEWQIGQLEGHFQGNSLNSRDIVGSTPDLPAMLPSPPCPRCLRSREFQP
jgi:hypothetical protein